MKIVETEKTSENATLKNKKKYPINLYSSKSTIQQPLKFRIFRMIPVYLLCTMLLVQGDLRGGAEPSDGESRQPALGPRDPGHDSGGGSVSVQYLQSSNSTLQTMTGTE